MAKLLSVTAFLILTVGACGRQTIPSKPRSPDRSAIVRSANADYDFAAPLAPVPAAVSARELVNRGVPDAARPRDVSIARATLKPNHTPPGSGEILARIHSDSAYVLLGIPPGDSYLWRDTRSPAKEDTTWRAYVVPVDSTHAPSRLKRAPIKGMFAHGDPRVPRLVFATTRSASDSTLYYILGLCFDDPVCGILHCGYGSIYQ